MGHQATISRFLLRTTATFAVLITAPAIMATHAYAGPDGGVVTGGSANITINGDTTTINQSSERAIIKWNTYDVNAAEHVRYQQPSSSSITVNRITDSKASRIDGRISANGNIILINPNGIVFGASSIVDVGGVVATSSDLADDNEFMNGGAVRFDKHGNHDAKIINNGTMTVRDAGLAGLVAPHVENNGVIRAHMGKVQLASGDIHTIDFAGDGLIKLEVSDAVMSQSVKNTGTIEADGGDVLITAAQARNLVDALIINTGTIRANTVAQQTGSVTINATGLSTVELPQPQPIPNLGTGTVVNTGTILAEGNDLNENGGEITILADAITLGDGSYISAAADRDGGHIRVGGDYQGGNNMPRSNNTIVSDLAVLSTSSRRYGRGGRIILWSDNTAEFYGNIDAQGGLEGGDGGFVEVSGKNYLAFEGTVNLLAPHGEIGTLLLDPTNITISAGADANVTGTSPYAPNADSVTSVLNVTTLQNALALGNVIVQTRATGAQAGNITVDAAITWSSGTTLILDAHANIIVNQSITGGSLTMIAGTDVQLLANISGIGTLTMQAAADATTVGIGGGAGVFNISAADIPYIQSGWSNVVIGRDTGSGLMTANAVTWNNNLTLRSGTGNITIAGVQTMGSRNLSLITNGTVALSVANAIAGSGVLTLQQSTFNAAVGLGGAAGALNMSTTSLGRIVDGWSQINIGRADGTGTLTMAGSVTWRDNVSIFSNTGVISVTGAQTFGANNVRIVTDADITLGITNALYASGGTLIIEQRSANTSIGLGDSQAGVINLTSTEVTRLRDGFTSITIGRADGTGDINIGTTSWLDPLTILSGSGDVYINNTMTMAANALTVTTQGGDLTATGGITQTTTGNIAITTSGGAINTAAITQVTGNLNMSSGGGSITLSGATAGTTTGAWNFNSANGNIIVNGNVTKTGGTVAFDAGTGSFTANNTMSFGAAATTITTGGVSGIAINNTVAQTTGALTLTTAGGSIITNGSATMTQTTGNLSMTTNNGAINLGGALTQTSGASGNLILNSGSGLLNVGGTLTRTGGTVDIDSTNSISFGNVSFGAANVTIDTTGSSTIDISGAASQSTGNTTINTVGGSITLTNGFTHSSTGNLSLITQGASIISAAISQTTGALLLDSHGGSINVTGTVTKTGGTFTADSGVGQLTLSTLSLGAGNLVIVTDSDLALNGTVSGTGTLSITQSSANTGIGIGAGQAGTLLIDGTELTRIQNGWSSRTFGRTDGTAALNVAGGLTWQDSLVLQSGSGVITLDGTQTFGGNSLTIRTDADVVINGNLSGGIAGTASGTFALVQSTASTSMGVGDGQTGTISISSAERGFINATGTGTDGWGSIVFGRVDGTGDLNVGGFTWTDALTLRTGSGQLNINGTTTMTGYNLTISTDSNLQITGNLVGNQYLAIVGSSAATTIGVGDGQAGTLHLSNAELTGFQTSWRGITIGSTTSTGDVNVGGRTWSDPLTLRSGIGQIHLNGPINMGGNALTISTDANLQINDTLAGTGTLTIQSNALPVSYGIGDGQAGDIQLSDAELNRIADGWSSITFGLTTGTGAFNIGARTWNDSVVFRNGGSAGTVAMNINRDQNAGANNMSFSTNSDIAINGNLTGTGTLTIRPTGNVSVGVGDGQAGTFHLSDAELNRITTGWTTVVVGLETSSQAMNIAGRTWNNSMDFRTGSGVMNINGDQNMGANNLTLRTAADLVLGHILAGTGTLSILNSGTGTGNTMAIGDSETGVLKLNNSDLGYFMPYGWTSLSFGTAASTAALNIGAMTWDSHVAFRNGSGLININGVQTVNGGNNMNIVTNADVVINQNINGTGTLSIGQSAATITMAITDSQTGALHLSNADLGRIGSGWSDLIFGTIAATTSTYGTLRVGAYTWNNNVTFRTAAMVININGTQNAGSHNLSIISNGNTVIAAAAMLTGAGTFTYATQTNNTALTIGGGSSILTGTEVDNITNGWSNLIFGRSDTTTAGTLNVANRTWNDNVTFQTGAGLLTLAGATMGSNNLTIATNSALTLTGALSGTGQLTIRNASGNTHIGVGDGEAGTLLLTNAKLAFINDGWSGVTIGSTSSFGNINIGARTWLNPMTFVTQGNVVLNGIQDTTETTGTTLVFATTGGSFINNVGANAIDPGAGGRYLVYSVDENNDTINGLVRPTIVTNESYAGYGPGSVVETGNVYLYSGSAAKIIFIQIDDVDKFYGDSNPIYTYSYIGGLQNGDLLNDVILSYSMSAAGSNVLDDAGTTRTIMGSFNAGLGYTINVINGTLTVIKAILTVTADSDTRIYGDANPTYNVSYSGFRNGDGDVDLNTEATANSAALITSDVGNYAITASGAADDNYDFVYVDGNLSITKATLTVTSQNNTRVYGDGDPAFTFNYTGFRNGDTLGMIDTQATGASGTTATSNVGNYTITGSSAFDNNYTFAYVNSGQLNVTKATVTVTTQNDIREYGATDPTFNAVYTGFRNGDDIDDINTLATLSSTAIATSGIGAYDISATGADDNNYTFTYVNSGDLTITKAMITATVQNATRVYGAADPTFNIVYTGFRNSEGTGAFNTLATAGTAATVTSNVGTYDITATGADANNYNFTYIDGDLSITKATLTATAGSGSREYGEANPVFGVTYTGFVNGDDVNDIGTLATASSAGATGNVGNHAVVASGGFDDNYTFTYVDGVLNITKAVLTTTAHDATRQVGTANPTFLFSYSGFKNGENSSVIDTHATASTAADLLSPIGPYAITASGAFDNNYDFIYVDGVLTVTTEPVGPPVTNTPPLAQNVIPPTVDDSLAGRYIYQSFLYPVAGEAMSYPQGGIIVLPEEQLFSDRSADDDFLIAITEGLTDYVPLQ